MFYEFKSRNRPINGRFVPPVPTAGDPLAEWRLRNWVADLADGIIRDALANAMRYTAPLSRERGGFFKRLTGAPDSL